MAGDIKRIQHVDLNEKVYRALRDRILRREFKAGERLDVHLLAEKLDVSRTPVKDAFNRLAREGLLEIVPRRKTVVSKLNLQDVEELFDIRLMIELSSIERGIERAREPQIQELRALVDQGTSILQHGNGRGFDYDAFSKKNEQFHLKIVELSENRKLLEIYRSLNMQVQVARAVTGQEFEPCRLAQAEHEEIVTNYEARNLPATKKAL